MVIGAVNKNSESAKTLHTKEVKHDAYFTCRVLKQQHLRPHVF